MKNPLLLTIACVCSVVGIAWGEVDVPNLTEGFVHPPASARPWVYWFALDGNISSNGITADLEAMQRVGIGGVLYVETEQGTPPGPAAFAGPLWRNYFKFICAEAHRLGLQVNINNDAGWCGSAGPWVTPELSMQRVVWTETNLSGPLSFRGIISQPQTQSNYYRDIALFAFPTPSVTYKIPDISDKSAEGAGEVPIHTSYADLPEGTVIPRDSIIDLTKRMGTDGNLRWQVPAGHWTLLRMGHTTTGVMNHPAPPGGLGLESDKLSKKASQTTFDGLVAKVVGDSRDLAGRGKTLVSAHIDSWETGSQNWTPLFRQEFRRLRGYDPLPLLPVITGRVIDNLEVSERFLWDIRKTVGDLLAENYAGEFRDLAHRHDLRLSIEAYGLGQPADDMTYGGRADEPMCEFWSWNWFGFCSSCTEMASTAHTYGKRILGAESFTANDHEKWQGYPGSIKELGDWALCEGVNRFVFHRYAMQPWTNPDRPPGMSMRPWGLHYERTETWWEMSKAWHEYLARCQFLLRQGLFVADLCFLNPERSPGLFHSPIKSGFDRPGYGFDGCTPEVVLTRMSVKGGSLVLPDGMSYRMLVLPKTGTMTPKLLSRIRKLVNEGATIVGGPPVKSPSLSDYPKCDREIKAIAHEMWGGDPAPAEVTERPFGKGRIIWGGAFRLDNEDTPATNSPSQKNGDADYIPVINPYCQLLAKMGVPPDFTFATADSAECLRFIHRVADGTDLYFVANKLDCPEDALCSFRVQGRRPELWYPDTGRMARIAVYDEQNGCIRVQIHFDPTGSVFVVFRDGQEVESDRIKTVTRNKAPLLATTSQTLQQKRVDNNEGLTGTFTYAVWADPGADIDILPEAADGASGERATRHDALYPPPGDEVYSQRLKFANITTEAFAQARHDAYSPTGQACCGLAVGRNGVCVFEHGAGYFAPILAYATPITNWTHVAVVYRNGRPSLYLNGEMVHQGLKSTHVVHPGVGTRYDPAVSAFKGELSPFAQFDRDLSASDIAQMMKTTPAPENYGMSAAVELTRDASGKLQAETFRAGGYEITSASGQSQQFEAAAPPQPVELRGPWEVSFPRGWGAPEHVTFPSLTSWPDYPDVGVKYFSGTANYSKNFSMADGLLAVQRHWYLDLGKVAVMAHVQCNGQDLGILWKAPFRINVTDALRVGENRLEIQVVNLWINRLIGDEQLPEDSQRNTNGTLKEWPAWLGQGQPSPTGRRTFATWRLWKKADPLVESGLIGPVTLTASELMDLPRR